jgi:chromosomal replication initiator protein
MKVWEDFLKKLDLELGKRTVDFWLRSLKFKKKEPRRLFFTATDSFQVLWFEEHVRSIAEARLLREDGQKLSVVIEAESKCVADANSKLKNKRSNSGAPTLDIRADPLDPSAHFDWIYEYEGNQLALRALKKLNESPEALSYDGFNPLYLYGPSACGKSLMMMATAHTLHSLNKKVLYVKGETFTHHVVQAIRLGLMQDFRRFYRGIDVLLVDGVEIFSHKVATQEEFFHTFNSLHVGAKAIIVSARVAPKDLKGIEPRLISRFEWGLLALIDSPLDYQLEKILKLQSLRLKINLKPAQSQVLLEHFASDTRELVKALATLNLRSHRHKLPIDSLSSEEICELLSDLKAMQSEKKLTADRIVQIVSDFYGITTKDLLGKGQQREFSLPRQIAMRFCREKLQMPFLKIAHFFGRDHSTVMTSCKLIEKMKLDHHSRLSSEFFAIEQKL